MNTPDPDIQFLLLPWLTVFGACIGSFLNVVIHRLPRGESLSSPPSHCPKCGHAIRWYDNVPVLGWLWLRGKCRDCTEPISIRYPMVEGVGGFVFGTITWWTLQQGGLPPDKPLDLALIEFCLFVFCLSNLVLTGFASVLIKMDGQKIPWQLLAAATVCLVIVLVLCHSPVSASRGNQHDESAKTQAKVPCRKMWEF